MRWGARDKADLVLADAEQGSYYLPLFDPRPREEAHRQLASAAAAMGNVSGCVFGVTGAGFAVVASGTPVVALDAHRILAISGDDKNRAKLARAMRKWKELSGVPYPDIASAARVAHGLISRRRYSVEAVVVGYDTPTNDAWLRRVVPGPAAPPCPSDGIYGAVGPGALACKAVLDAGYRHGMSPGDAIELVGSCVAEIRRLGATIEFAVWYIDRDGAVPVKKEIMEAMARGRQMVTDYFNLLGLD